MGTDFSATAGNDHAGAACAGEMFTAALESACDTAPQAGTTSTGKSHAGTTPGLAAWLLALALEGEVPADAGTAQARASRSGGEAEITLPGDDDNQAEEEAVADVAAGADAIAIAPFVEVTQCVQTPDVALTATPGESSDATGGGSAANAVAGNVAGSVAGTVPGSVTNAVTDGITEGAAADQDADAPLADSRQATSRGRVSGGADRPDDLSAAQGGERGRSGVDANVAPQTTAATPQQGAGDHSGDAASAVATTETGRREATESPEVLTPPAGHKTAGQPRAAAAAPDATASASATPPASAFSSPAGVEVVVEGQPVGPRGVPADAPVNPQREREAASAGRTLDARTTSVDGVTGATLSSTGSSEASGSQDSSQRNDAEAPGQRLGFEMAVTRTAAAAMLTLVASPDGTLRLTPAAHITPMVTPLLPEEQAANIEKMVQTMRVMTRDKVTEATVRLRPEHFGEVSIQVRVEGKSVSAVIHTDSSSVREWLQGQEGSLRNGLSEQGLQLDRLVVHRDGRQDRREGQQQPSDRRRPRPRPASDAQQTFEITV